MLAAKVTDAEAQAWEALLSAMATSGPRPTDASALRWLIEEECRRRSIAWPGPEAPPVAPGAVTPPHPHATRGAGLEVASPAEIDALVAKAKKGAKR